MDPFHVGINEVLQFLNHLFQNTTNAFGTFNSHRSALALILPENIGTDRSIKRFLKGICRLRPSRPKYEFTWDTDVVLSYLAKAHPVLQIPLKMLTYKLCTLLALITGQRIQTLSLIRVSNIHQSNTRIQIRITDPTKTSLAASAQPCLQIPFFTARPELCVASTLLEYLDRTSPLRTQEDFLFLTVRQPHQTSA